MTPQETFNIVAKHLLTQMEQAKDRSGCCSYRGENGLKCAVGCLIPDDKYDPYMEGQSPLTTTCMSGKKREPGSVGRLLLEQGHDLSLAEALQTIHDNYDPDEWRERLQELATRRNLTFTE